MGCGLGRQQARIAARCPGACLHALTREVAKRIQAGAGLTQPFNLAAFAPNRKTHGLWLVGGHQTAQRILRPKLQKRAYTFAVPHGMHTFGPAHRVFVQIGNVRAGGRGVTGVELRVDAAHQGPRGRMHIKGAQTAQRNIAQHAHAGVVKGQAHVEHNGRDTPLAQALAGFLQHLARTAQNKLIGRIEVGNVEGGPSGAGLVDGIHIGVHGHHARLAGGACFHFAHMHSAGVNDIPGHFGLNNTREAQADHFTKAMTTKKCRIEPQRCKHTPLGVLKHEYIGGLPARGADLLHVCFIHETQDVPVGHGGKAVHGCAGSGEIIVQLAAHARPYSAKTTAHDCQRRHASIPHRRNPQAAIFQSGKIVAVGIGWQGKQFLPPCGAYCTNAPLLARLVQIGVAHAIKSNFVLMHALCWIF